jgi:hypothetical protein
VSALTWRHDDGIVVVPDVSEKRRWRDEAPIVREVRMRFTMQGETTAESGRSPCGTCRYATIVRGVRLRDEIIECSELGCGRGRITFPVTSCSAYSDKRRPSLRAMEEIAWVLRSGPKETTSGSSAPAPSA